MKTISINMKFWDDGHQDSTRIRNVKFAWKELKKLADFLNSKRNFYVKATLFDFSKERVIEDAVHIPYEVGEYKISEKTNIMIDRMADYRYFMMMDCDTFFDEDDYEKLYVLMCDLNPYEVRTFDLAKLNDNIDDYIIDDVFVKQNSDWSYAYAGSKENKPLEGRYGGLGGVYICYTKLLIQLGGFNEKYVGWGGEDGDMLDRIMTAGFTNHVLPTHDFAPFHLPHLYDFNNIKYKQRFENE